MGELHIMPFEVGMRCLEESWECIKFPSHHQTANLKEMRDWCDEIVGERNVDWQCRHLRYWYFKDKSHAMLFKLAFG